MSAFRDGKSKENSCGNGVQLCQIKYYKISNEKIRIQSHISDIICIFYCKISCCRPG